MPASPRVIALSAAAALALSLGVGGVALASGGDEDSVRSCKDYSKQKDAQDDFDGNRVRLAHLDTDGGGDKNGVACDKPKRHDGDKDRDHDKDGDKGREPDTYADKERGGHKNDRDASHDTCDASWEHKKKDWNDCDDTCDAGWEHKKKDWDEDCDCEEDKKKDSDDCDSSCDDPKKDDSSKDDDSDDSDDNGGQVKVHPKGGVDTGGWSLETATA